MWKGRRSTDNWVIVSTVRSISYRLTVFRSSLCLHDAIYSDSLLLNHIPLKSVTLWSNLRQISLLPTFRPRWKIRHLASCIYFMIKVGKKGRQLDKLWRFTKFFMCSKNAPRFVKNLNEKLIELYSNVTCVINIVFVNPTIKWEVLYIWWSESKFDINFYSKALNHEMLF